MPTTPLRETLQAFFGWLQHQHTDLTAAAYHGAVRTLLNRLELSVRSDLEKITLEALQRARIAPSQLATTSCAYKQFIVFAGSELGVTLPSWSSGTAAALPEKVLVALGALRRHRLKPAALVQMTWEDVDRETGLLQRNDLGQLDSTEDVVAALEVLWLWGNPGAAVTAPVLPSWPGAGIPMPKAKAGRMVALGEKAVTALLREQVAARQLTALTAQMPDQLQMAPMAPKGVAGTIPRLAVPLPPVTLADLEREAASGDAPDDEIHDPADTSSGLPEELARNLASGARTVDEFREITGRAPTADEVFAQKLT